MHKSYKKTVAILITCALIGALLCFPVSAIVSGNAELTLLNTSEMYTPGVAGSETSATVSNNVTYSSASFQVSGTGQRQITLNFNFDSPDTYGKITVYIDSSATSTGSSVISNPSYQGVLVNGSYNRDWDYNFVNSSLVAVEYTGYIPSQFSVRSYYNCTKEITGYIVSTFEWTPIDKGSQDIINNQNQNTQSIIDNQNSNRQEITSNNNWNTDREIQADKENTQSIIDNQNELAEQEKQEITNSGGQATDAMDSIPNESEGFINALGTFVSTMSTTDTACSITFPAIKTPSFAGIPAATLSEEKDVDFSTAISLIPSDIMRLIQALTTIALIVFCFKELYDTISEALTRKKANSDG